MCLHTPQAKFGIPLVAQSQLEIYTTSVLLASLRPPVAARSSDWRVIMDRLGAASCAAYRSVVVSDPRFIGYFSRATPQVRNSVAVVILMTINEGAHLARHAPGTQLFRTLLHGCGNEGALVARHAAGAVACCMVVTV